MATTTTNLELTLPEGTENITRSVLNTNFTIIDEASLEMRTNPVIIGNLTMNRKDGALGRLNNGRKSGTSSGSASIAFGEDTVASNTSAVAIGYRASATGYNSKSFGYGTVAEGQSTFAFGEHNATFDTSTVSNWVANKHYYPFDMVMYNGNFYICITENTDGSFTSSKWRSGYNKYVEIVGNSFSSSGASNARTLDWAGNEYLMGDLYVGCGPDSTGGSKVLTESNLATATTTETQAIITDYVRS